MAGGPKQSEPVTVRITSLAGQQQTLVFERGMRLGQMQKQLCAAFSRRFPMTQAGLVVGGRAFSEFSDRPLLEVGESNGGNGIEVVFSLTTDMTFIDQCFRGRPSFKEDMEEDGPGSNK